MKALAILKAFAARHESAYGFNNILVASLGDITEALEELSSIEQRIAELEYEGQLQWDTHQMCQSINLNKIRKLEAPKNCEGTEMKCPKCNSIDTSSSFFGGYFETHLCKKCGYTWSTE